jgi:hypothetical protein
MPNILRRLQKLEARVTDHGSGYLPHSEAWFDYWAERLERFMAGDDTAVNGMPLAFVDAMLARADREALQEEIGAR